MTLEELHQAIVTGEIDELIRVVEARQRKILSQIADAICARPEVRLVLVAGGSAAGKTTTAKRLATQLRVNERAAMHLSTDDYFVGDARNPRDENGEFDYEHVRCVDIECLVDDLNALFRGEQIRERRFDFIRHEPVYTDKTLRLPENGFVVLEGIHALNPILTEGVEESRKFRVFVEPKPSLEILPGRKPSAREARCLRRLVRDNQFRKLDPSMTIRLWPKVIAGEEKWIEPYRTQANVVFDSYLVYEMAVLKAYVGGLLVLARKELGDVPEVMTKMLMLENVPVLSPDLVPGDSIIRETIGGSQLDY